MHLGRSVLMALDFTEKSSFNFDGFRNVILSRRFTARASNLNYGEHPRSRITVHLADFQLQLN